MGVLQQLIKRVDSQVASSFNVIQSVKTMQGQVDEVRELAHEALDCAHANSQSTNEVNQEVSTPLQPRIYKAYAQQKM